MRNLQPNEKSIVFSLSDGNGSPVPVEEVQIFLKQLQDIAYDLGSLKAGTDSSKPGIKPENIKKACRFEIVDMAFASAEFLISTPEPDPNLFPSDFPQEILQGTSHVFRDINHGDPEALSHTIPDEIYRDKIVKKARAAIPSKESGRSLSVHTLEFDAVNITRPDSKSMKILLPLTNGKTTIGEEFVEKYIDAKGIALVDHDHKFKKWQKILSIEELDAIQLTEVRGSRITFNFDERILFMIEEVDDNISLSLDELDLLVTADSLDKAVTALGEEFEFLWAEYAQEDDSNLHKSGISLKESLKRIVSKVTIND